MNREITSQKLKENSANVRYEWEQFSPVKVRGIVSAKGGHTDWAFQLHKPRIMEPTEGLPSKDSSSTAMPAQPRDPMPKTGQEKAPSPDDDILQGRKKTLSPNKTRSSFHMLFF